jgi:hypothetical protein
MHRSFHPLARRAGRTVVLAAIAFAAACSSDSTSPEESADLARGGAQGPDLRAATAAKDKHAEGLMRQEGIEGVGVTLTARGTPAVALFLAHGAVGRVPRELDGIPVELVITGKIEAILPQAKPGSGGSTTTRLTRPVPIGISIGNVGECSAGTLGARVKSGSSFFILSNNHVLALQNTAAKGSAILQPGRYDTNCVTSLADQIATLGNYVPISYSGNNTVDAALAPTTTASVGNGTVAGGYGVPNTQTMAAALNMAVQKCGRTTGCTKGTVTAINATVNVQYSGGVARFVNQVVISGRRGAFSKAGDSGSLIVTDNASANPVALLFAGGQTTTIGNPIGAVLSALNVTIDGK